MSMEKEVSKQPKPENNAGAGQWGGQWEERIEILHLQCNQTNGDEANASAFIPGVETCQQYWNSPYCTLE